MRIIFLSLLALITLSSCGGGSSNTKPLPSPYPSVPLGASLEIGVSENIQKGGNYKVTGTEPFWSVEVIPGTATLSRPGETEIITSSYTTSEDDKGAIIVVKGVKGDFFLNLLKGECSDGMSDTKYAYKATLLVGSENLSGCAIKL